jgi:hypothetical protein
MGGALRLPSEAGRRGSDLLSPTAPRAGTRCRLMIFPRHAWCGVQGCSGAAWAFDVRFISTTILFADVTPLIALPAVENLLFGE